MSIAIAIPVATPMALAQPSRESLPTAIPIVFLWLLPDLCCESIPIIAVPMVIHMDLARPLP